MGAGFFRGVDFLALVDVFVVTFFVVAFLAGVFLAGAFLTAGVLFAAVLVAVVLAGAFLAVVLRGVAFLTVSFVDLVADFTFSWALSDTSSTLSLALSNELFVFSVADLPSSFARAAASSAALRVSATISMSADSDFPPSGDRLSFIRKRATANSLTKRIDTRASKIETKKPMKFTIEATGFRWIESKAVEKNVRPHEIMANQKNGIMSFSLSNLSKEKKKLKRFFTWHTPKEWLNTLLNVAENLINKFSIRSLSQVSLCLRGLSQPLFQPWEMKQWFVPFRAVR